MAESEKDTQSIQEAQNMVTRARDAQRIWATATQQQVDRVCEAMSQVAYEASERLGRTAAEETGFGVPEHKKLKNQFAAKGVWDSIRDIKTVGIVRSDKDGKLIEIAWPMGVVAALIPSTNPTSTTINKILISLKARNAIVVAPHPSAKDCSLQTAEIMADAAVTAGAPPGLINCLTKISLAGTQELMSHKYTAVILATGGGEMVRVAHSKGNPAKEAGLGMSLCMLTAVRTWKKLPNILSPAKLLTIPRFAPPNRQLLRTGLLLPV